MRHCTHNPDLPRSVRPNVVPIGKKGSVRLKADS